MLLLHLEKRGALGGTHPGQVINKGTTRSQWVEYAVKVIDESTMQELGSPGGRFRCTGVTAFQAPLPDFCISGSTTLVSGCR